jgi:nitroreductase
MRFGRACATLGHMATSGVTSASALELVGRAILAPSSHNTQPWRFRVRGSCIRLFADRTRALPVNDPFDRELVISCGAALFNLRVAAAFTGTEAAVALLPDPSDGDLLAEVQLGEGGERDAEAVRLFRAIPARRTYRRRFSEESVPATAVEELVAAARAERAELVVLDDDEREAVAEMVAEGDREQFSDPRWRRELAMWLHPRRSGDGLVQPVPQVARFVVSHLDMGGRTGAADAALALESPLLAVLDTGTDSVADWMAAGQALQRVLLTACGDGLQASFLNQPLQVLELRPQVARELGRPDRHPQVLLRIGYPSEEVQPAPRRPLEDALLP